MRTRGKRSKKKPENDEKQRGVIHINSQQDFDDLKDQKGISFVKFTAKWCAPCRGITPLYGEMAQVWSDNAQFLELDVDQHPNLAKACRVQQLPSFHCLIDGKFVDETHGGSWLGLSSFVGESVSTFVGKQKEDSRSSFKERCSVVHFSPSSWYKAPQHILPQAFPLLESHIQKEGDLIVLFSDGRDSKIFLSQCLEII